MLSKARWLDPREKRGESIADSVWIPLSELASRVFELPQKGEVVRIPDVGSDAVRAIDWLLSNGHTAEIGHDFELGPTGPCRLWSPNPFLEEVLPSIQPGLTLDLACGSGRDAVYMGAMGFEVTGVDHLRDAIDLAKRLAARYQTRESKLTWQVADLECAEFNRPFDLITCFFYLDRELLRRLPRLVKPGGHVVIETFTTVHRERYGKPRSERFTLSPYELPEILGSLKVRSYHEGWHGDRHTARLWAYRPESA